MEDTYKLNARPVLTPWYSFNWRKAGHQTKPRSVWEQKNYFPPAIILFKKQNYNLDKSILGYDIKESAYEEE